MSHTREKIKYYEEGNYGSTVERTLYLHINNSCDIATFYYDDGKEIFSFYDTIDNNLLDAMIELACNNQRSRENEIEIMNAEDRKICGL